MVEALDATIADYAVTTALGSHHLTEGAKVGWVCLL
jgi:hypothetical protein